MNIYLPITGRINEEKLYLFQKTYDFSIIYPGDKLLSYIESGGGVTNVANLLYEKINDLPIPTIAYGGWVSSAAALIFSGFKQRFAFEDSSFLIHPCIPPKGMEGNAIFKEYDLQVWKLLEKKMRISAKEIEALAKKEKRFSSSEALEIGFVHQILKGSYKDHESIIKKEGLLL